MRRPLGCFTFSALVAAIVALLAIGGAISVLGHAIFSPGALSAYAQDGATTASTIGGVHSHAELEGRCDACHAPIWSGKKMGDLCLACHGDVATQASSRKGLHANLDANPATCLRCHTEHNGADAPATLADPAVFPHEQTGWALTAHLRPATKEPVGCRSCHPGSPRDYASPSPDTTCVTCHQQRDAARMAVHVDTYGSTCRNCHDGKDSYGHAFQHTGYALVGKHEQAACAACHKGSTTLAALRATSTVCLTCHQKDTPHSDLVGTACGSCHTTVGWQGATLDHTAQTRFPLAGKHASVACESCHVNRQWRDLGVSCVACHQKDDPHNGKFGSDCASCHNPSSWKDATFDHGKTGFALVASHASVACESCHRNGQFAGTPTKCVGCHASNDRHNGALGTNCEACHKATSWSDAAYDHNNASFKLAGAHASASCEQCHKGGPPQSTSTACASCHGRPSTHDTTHFASNCATCHSTSGWQPAAFDHTTTSYRLTGAHLSATCQKCHGSPITSFANAPTVCASCHAKPSSHTAAFGSNCGSCHTTKAWRPATFDHSRTGFALTGAHTSLVCSRCHTSPNTFTGLSATCGSCHSRPSDHSAAFSSNCASCHSTRAWLPSTFKHSSTGWSLTGAHSGLACTKCHTGSTFGGLSTTCSSCHARPSNHPSGYTTCSQCHSTSAWTPVRYSGAHTFPMGHGGADGICWTCHPSSLSSYTCSKCHSDASMTSRHQGISGFSLTTCAKCHPTGGGGG